MTYQKASAEIVEFSSFICVTPRSQDSTYGPYYPGNWVDCGYVTMKEINDWAGHYMEIHCQSVKLKDGSTANSQQAKAYDITD